MLRQASLPLLFIILVSSTAAISHGDLHCGSEISNDTEMKQSVQGCTGKGLEIVEDNVTLNCRDYSITGANDRHAGVAVDSHSNVEIKNCDINGFYSGISLENVSDSTVRDVNSSYNYATGIKLVGSEGNTVTSNNVSENWDGVFLQNSSDNKIIENDIHRNTIDGVHLFYGSFNNTVKQNNLTENRGHGLAPAVCGNSIENNIAGAGKPVMYRENAQGLEISDTNKYSEIVLCNVSDSVIKNISIDNRGLDSDGVLMVASDDNTVKNSYFEDVRTAVYFYRDSERNLVHENIVKSSDIGLRLRLDSDDNRLEANSIEEADTYIKVLRNSTGNDFVKNTIEETQFSILNNQKDLNITSESQALEYTRSEGSDNLFGFLALITVVSLITLFFVWRSADFDKYLP